MPVGRKRRKGAANSYVDWAVKNTTRAIVLAKLLSMGMPETYFPEIDVVRHEKLKNRALPQGSQGLVDPLVITRGLVIVDGKNNIMLIFLPKAMPERLAAMIGGKVGPLLNELLQKGTPVVRGEDKMVVGNVVSTNYGRNSSLRSAIERAHPHIAVAVDDLLATIVLAIRQPCPFALIGLPAMSDVARGLATVVPGTCVTTAAFTRNYHTSPHRDSADNCGDFLMSAIAWFTEGGGVLGSIIRIVLNDLGVELLVPSGSFLMCDMAKIKHSTQGCEPLGTPALTAVALYCKKDVLNMAMEDVEVLT